MTKSVAEIFAALEALQRENHQLAEEGKEATAEIVDGIIARSLDVRSRRDALGALLREIQAKATGFQNRHARRAVKARRRLN